MNSRNRHSITLLIFALTIILALFLACDDNVNQPPSNNEIPEVEPGTPFNPSPADNATGLGMNIVFRWECENNDSIPRTFELYAGQDSLILMGSTDTSMCFVHPWAYQKRAQEMLIQIFQMQTAYRLQYRSYCANGTVASATSPTVFSELMITIDSTDKYCYTMISTSHTFTCLASGSIDNIDPEYDRWSINQTGEISNDWDDTGMSYMPGQTYSWQVKSYREGDTIYSPIWHLTTSADSISPAYRVNLPCEPYPSSISAYVSPSTIFSWTCRNTMNPPLRYDFYLGFDGAVQLRSRSLTDPFLYSEWRRQNRAEETLQEICALQRAYLHSYGSYCLDGVSANRENNNFEMLGFTFANDDFYTYTIDIDDGAFGCMALANLDVDEQIDTWIVRDIWVTPLHVNNDCDIPYQSNREYNWRIVVHDSRGNEMQGPLWIFSTYGY